MNTDTLFSDDFEAYRKLEAEKCVQVIREMIIGHRDGEFFKGAMFMLKSIISIPIDVAKTPEAKERALFLKESMLHHLEGKLMRCFLDG